MTPAEPAPGRRPAIDALRGLVMVLMALDHARDFFTPTPFDPVDASATTPGWFFARWVTHLCAPGFVFLAGAAAWHKGRRAGARALSRWLVVRGLWLVLLELTLNNVLWFASFWPLYGWFFQVQVLWAIGVAMVVLGLLVRLPRVVTAVFVAVTLVGHNLLDGVPAAPMGEQTARDLLWALVHQRALFPFDGGLFLVNYPLVPWVGVLAAGWLLGGWLEARRDRARAALALGLGATAAFVLLRLANGYGDPRPWSVSDRGPLYTALDFLACEKYPPSLAYLLMTLGPLLVVLAALERAPARLADGALRPLVVFGRVPLFFYFAHVALLHGASAALAALRGRDPGWFWSVLSGQELAGYEPRLAVTVLVTAAALLALGPACVWWGRLKAARRGGWTDWL